MSHFIEGKSVTGENIFSETDMFGENKIAAKWLFQNLSCRRRWRKWVSLISQIPLHPGPGNIMEKGS